MNHPEQDTRIIGRAAPVSRRAVSTVRTLSTDDLNDMYNALCIVRYLYAAIHKRGIHPNVPMTYDETRIDAIPALLSKIERCIEEIAK